jgi:hypothetical protein
VVKKGVGLADCYRSCAQRGEAEIGGGMMGKAAERCVETADAGRFPSRHRMLTGGLGRFAADRKAPRATRSSNASEKISRES